MIIQIMEMFWIFLKFRDSKLHSTNQNNKFCIWYLNLQMSSPIFRQYYNIFVFSVYFTITDYHSQNIFYFQNKRSAIRVEDCQTNQFHLGQSRYLLILIPVKIIKMTSRIGAWILSPPPPRFLDFFLSLCSSG